MNKEKIKKYAIRAGLVGVGVLGFVGTHCYLKNDREKSMKASEQAKHDLLDYFDYAVVKSYSQGVLDERERFSKEKAE